jgi:hypothetical protein
MNNKLEGMWNDVVMAYFKVLSQHLPEGTGKPQTTVMTVSLQA